MSTSGMKEFLIEARVGADLVNRRVFDYNMGAAQRQFKSEMRSMYPGKSVSWTSGCRELK
jgi:hypothetical protein